MQRTWPGVKNVEMQQGKGKARNAFCGQGLTLAYLLRCLKDSYPKFSPCVLLTCILFFSPVFIKSVFLISLVGFLASLSGFGAAWLTLTHEANSSEILKRSCLHVANNLILGVVVGSTVLPGFLAVSFLAEEYRQITQITLFSVFVLLSVLPSLWILSRLWPLAAFAFLAEADELRQPFRSLINAWNMTGEIGAFKNSTFPVLSLWVVFPIFTFFLPEIILGLSPLVCAWQAIAACAAVPFLFIFTLARGRSLYMVWKGPPPEETISTNRIKLKDHSPQEQSSPEGLDVPVMLQPPLQGKSKQR